MKLWMLLETKPYSEMTPREAARAKRYRANKYKEDRQKHGRDASGSNETNRETTAKWREQNPDKASKVNHVNYRVRAGDLPKVKPGKQRHHMSYEGGDGGRFLSINGSTNARYANNKKTTDTNEQ